MALRAEVWDETRYWEDIVLHFFDTDCLTGEDGAEIDLLVPEADASAVGDDDGLVVERVIDIWQALVWTCRGLIDLGRAFHVEGLVRALVVENLRKVIELSLLLEEVGSGGFSGFFLEGEVHALVTAVLLWMAGFDALNADAEPQPPYSELAEVEQGVGGSKRHPVVAADVCGQAALLKETLQDGESVVFARGGKSLAAEQVTAGMIGDGERIAILAITQQELAFVVGALQFVGTLT